MVSGIPFWVGTVAQTPLERTFWLLRYVERGELPEAAEPLFLLLGDCFPTGSVQETRPATMKQLHYIATLARLDQDGRAEWVQAAVDAGMDRFQAGHVISRLKTR